uniref:Uncharacterized protein n=1 Tax=Denticeps clupeoides TaxID=299321 RepID=A0AAY4B8S0_9TELE
IRSHHVLSLFSAQMNCSSMTFAELGKGAQCPVSPAGALHPVQGFLERYEAGPGCAARERGTKETHVIAVGTASHHAGQKVPTPPVSLLLTGSPR